MLKQRVITALVLLALVLLALFSEHSVYWSILVNSAILIGFWEWLKFCELTELKQQIICFALFVAFAAAAQFNVLPFALVVGLSCVLWFILFGFTLSDQFDVLHHPYLKLAIGILLLVAASTIVIRLHQLANGVLWILCFFFCVWAADVGAYFVGRRYGKTKLAPHISPGKTVEGLLGGVALAAIVFTPIMLWNFAVGTAVSLLLVILVTVLISVLGDLFESKMKRYVGLKDSSQILPGHGGVLDRIDSLLAAAPFFAMGLVLLGYAG